MLYFNFSTLFRPLLGQFRGSFLFEKRALSLLVFSGILLVVLFLTVPSGIFGASIAVYNISLDRSAVPKLNYADITLVADVGRVSEISLLEAGEHELAYTYDKRNGKLVFSTRGNRVLMSLSGPDADDFKGKLTIAPLKDGKKFAWSHSVSGPIWQEDFIDVFNAYSYRGTLYKMAESANNMWNEDWILEGKDIYELLEKGWALGLQTHQLSCDGSIDDTNLSAAYQELTDKIAASPRPNYRVHSFATPCVGGEHRALRQLLHAPEIAILNESGDEGLLLVNTGAANFERKGREARAYDLGQALGRNPAIELGHVDEANAIIDWMAEHASPTRHFWYNTFSRRGRQNDIAKVMAHVNINYDTHDNASIWVAPAEEVYAYLVVRNKIGVTVELPSYILRIQ